MALSAISYEILDDLLALRISNCTVTCPEEARDLKALRAAQMELAALQRAPATRTVEASAATSVKLSRRLQRLVHEAAAAC